jgi:hypothetical protein
LALAFSAVSMAAVSHAAIVSYDFGGAAQGQYSPATVNGATFASTTDTVGPTSPLGGYYFGQNNGAFSTLGNDILSSQGFNSDLTISFATSQYALSFDFANGDLFGSNGNDVLYAVAYNGTTAVATQEVTASVQPVTAAGNGGEYPEGYFNLASNSAFTSVKLYSYSGTLPALGSTSTDSLTIADMTSSTTPVPIPAASWLLGSSLLGGLAFLRRRKTLTVPA